MPELKQDIKFHAELSIMKHIAGHKVTNARGYETEERVAPKDEAVVKVELRADDLETLIDKLDKYLELIEEI